MVGYWNLFWTFFKIGLFTFGGGAAMLPMLRSEVVEKNRWATDDKYAVMKNGRKSALRVFDNREDAEVYLREKGGDYIQDRPAESRKCMDYCSCCEYCNFWRDTYGRRFDSV